MNGNNLFSNIYIYYNNIYYFNSHIIGLNIVQYTLRKIEIVLIMYLVPTNLIFLEL